MSPIYTDKASEPTLAEIEARLARLRARADLLRLILDTGRAAGLFAVTAAALWLAR